MTHDGFLQDIIEYPDDDVPRLIYADWLEDNGDPQRAQFIRVQCELARLAPEDPRRGRLAEEEATFEVQQAIWRVALPRFGHIEWGNFTRGFVGSVTVFSIDAFRGQAPVLFRAAPIQSARIFYPPTLQDLRVLCACPHLARLTELNLGANRNRMAPSVEDRLLALIAELPPTPSHITHGNRLGPAAASVLVSSPHLANLTSLLLHNHLLDNEGTQVLAEGLLLPRLRELYLSGNWVGDAGVAALAASPHLPALTDLDLRDNRIENAGVVALAASPHRGNLRTLYLVNNSIGSPGALALAESPHLPQLRYLYLNHNSIGDAGARALALAPQRASLLELDLRRCSIGNAGARAFAESPHLNNLTELYLRAGNNIRDRGIIHSLEQRFGQVLRG